MNAILSVQKEYNGFDSDFESGWINGPKSTNKSSIDLLRETLQGGPSGVNLICTKGRSNKFWNVKSNGSTSIVTYGSIGTTGTSDFKVNEYLID